MPADSIPIVVLSVGATPSGLFNGCSLEGQSADWICDSLKAPEQENEVSTNIFERPMRWAQLTLVENDPGRFDPDFWLDYFRRVHADGAVLSAAGCICYYPTKIPYHYKSKWMGETDPFGYLVDGCRRMGMAVIARSDPHAVHQDAADAHPEWLHMREDGKPWPHWSTSGLWVTCALGPYNFEQMTAVHQEMVELYDIDAIFSNRWSGHGVCCCESCRRLFREAAGWEIPKGSYDPRDEQWRAYQIWRENRLFELCCAWDIAIKEIQPKACYIPNSGGGALSRMNMKRLGEIVSILFADRQGRRGDMAPWANGQNAKEYRGGMPEKPVGGIFSVGAGEKYRWKDSVEWGAELKIWAHDGIAHGLRPWFTKFGGVIHDRRWLSVVEEIYGWHHANEAYLRNSRNLAKVALVYSQQTGAFYGGPKGHPADPHKWVEDPISGVYQALVEARIPFEMIHEGYLDARHLAPFRTLILANVAALSDEQCEQIRAFVEEGGRVVATFETSRYDERGRLRSDLGLADLFGVTVSGEVEGPSRNSYLRIHHDADAGLLFSGLRDAERIINGVHRLPVEATIDFSLKPVTFVPSYPDLPMEEVYPRVEDSGHPEIYLRETRKGRVVYIPWDIARSFWELLTADHGKLLVGAVQWAHDQRHPAAVIGPGFVDVAVWLQESSLTVHLVNMTNPMAMRGAFRELIPCPAQKVEIMVPEGAVVKKVKLLTAGSEPTFAVQAGILSLTVPPFELHEVVAVDLQ